MVKENNKFLNEKIIFSAAFIFMLVLTSLCPYLSDDWHFKCIWEDFDPLPTTHKIRSLNDIIISMQNYYQKSGGRVLCHFIVYVFMVFPKWIYNIVNAFIFCIFGKQIHRACELIAEKKFGNKLLIIIFLLIPLTFPDFGDNVLWLSGSINYLWPTTLLLFCINWIYEKTETASLKEFLIMCFIILVSSMTNEISGGMILVAFIVRLFSVEHKKLKQFLIIPFIAAGTAVVVSAPGNAMRAEVVDKTSFTFSNMTLWLDTYLDYILNEKYMPFLWLIFFIILEMKHSKYKFGIILKKNLYFITGMCGLIALSATCTLTIRPMFIGKTFLTINFIYAFIEFYNIIHGMILKPMTSENCADILKRMQIATVILIVAVIAYVNNRIEVIILSLPLVFVLIACLILNIKEQISFSDFVIRILKKIKAAVLHILTCVLAVIVLIQGANYIKWTSQYKNFLNNVIAAVQEEDFEGARNVIKAINASSIMVPGESSRCPRMYLVEWLAMFYEKDFLSSDLADWRE